jgi:2-oxoglutarate ferredoxin oxidoreductase subunit beta
MEALVAGATFVARSFAGDPKQVESLLKAAISHRGIAVIDIVSPCVTFNNHDSSTKSYSWGKAQEDPLNELNFIPPQKEIIVGQYEGELEVEMHDGSKIVLRKLEPDYDPTDRMRAFQRMEEARSKQEFITGLIYVDEQERADLHELLHICAMPLVYLPEEKLRPDPEKLVQVMNEL